MMVRIIGRWNRELKRLEGKTKQHPEYVPLEELATNEVTAKQQSTSFGNNTL